MNDVVLEKLILINFQCYSKFSTTYILSNFTKVFNFFKKSKNMAEELLQ